MRLPRKEARARVRLLDLRREGAEEALRGFLALTPRALLIPSVPPLRRPVEAPLEAPTRKWLEAEASRLAPVRESNCFLRDR